MTQATAERDLLVRAVIALSLRDEDRATEANGVGFNGSDTNFGNGLAETPVEHWSEGNRVAAYEMLRKYAGQLAGYGIDFNEIPKPVTGKAPSRQTWKPGRFKLDLVAGTFRMRAGYVEDLVAAQKGIPGRRWDGDARVNLFPVSSAARVAMLITQFSDLGWEVSLEARAALDGAAPAEPVAERGKCEIVAADGGFALSFGYDRETVEESRQIEGRRWNAAAKVNTFPATPAAAAGLLAFAKAHAPATIEPDTELQLRALAAEAEEREAKQAELASLSRAKSAEGEIEGLGGTLRPFQQAGVAYVLRAGGRVLVADSMGVGKTVTALAAIQAADAFPAVVVCPASVKLSWRDHVAGPAIGAPNGWLPGRTVKVLSGRQPNGERATGADVYIINQDILSGWVEELKGVNPQALVLDECHGFKSKRAQRTVAALELAKSIPASGLVLGLSGTPILNRPIELTSQLEILGRLNEFGGFMKFAHRYCGAYRDQYGWRFDGATQLEELNERLRERCMLRRTKAEVMAELPAKQIARVPVGLSNADEYASAEADVVAWLRAEVEADERLAESLLGLSDEERATAIAAAKNDAEYRARQAEHLVRLNALRHIAARGKVAAAVSWITDFLAGSDEKLIVFAHHTEIQDRLLAEFPDAAHVLGSDSIEVRNRNVQRFQSDSGCRLVVCSLQAAGIGITLTAASNVAFLELGWTPALHDQAEDRAHRMGQDGQVTCWYLLAEDTIDDDMHALIEEKRAVVTAATDGTASRREVSVMAGLEARLLAKGGAR